MSGLNVPLTVRIGDKHITSQVADIAFRKEAVGGVRSLTVNLSRDIGSLDADLAPFTKVYFYDGRTAQTVAEGRLSDSGRTADAGGQSWDIVAFGPVQHTSDVTAPLVYVDRTIGDDAWRQIEVVHQEATIGTGAAPGDLSVAPVQGILAQFPNDLAVIGGGSSRLIVSNTVLAASGQKLARVRANWDTGVTDAAYEVLLITGITGSGITIAAAAAANTAGGAFTPVVVTNFANGHDSVRLYFHRASGSTTVVGDLTWAFFSSIVVRAMQYTAAGAEITSGYSADTVTATEVVNDLLGRRLSEFDGAGASVAVTSEAISQLAYPQGVTAEQVLNDLMQIEPAYRWYTTPDNTGNGYGFRWEAWPTTVRYEVTLDDGGNFPLSAQDLYNVVCVTYKDESGRPWVAYRTMACPILDDQGLNRTATIDLGSELGSVAAAAAAGDAFLAQHNVPKNSGTIKVSRPIRDVISGRMVEPWEIEAGELIRVRGVESYPNSLNASDNDGQTVFRIWAMDYTSSDNSANLSLDADPTDLTSALVKLLNERTRR